MLRTINYYNYYHFIKQQAAITEATNQRSYVMRLSSFGKAICPKKLILRSN